MVDGLIILFVMGMMMSLAIIYRSQIIEKYKNLHEVSRYVSLKILVEYVYINIRDYITEKLETGLLRSNSKLYYDLAYYDGSQKYIIRFPKKRGPSSISRVIALSSAKDRGAGVLSVREGDRDVTELFKIYLGPSHNFHGIPTTPKMMGMPSIEIVYRDDTSMTFYDNDIITT